MRITSGVLRGRPLAAPNGEDVRPTQDRVREALFSMLGEAVSGASFLDLCAGSGAVGLEALSRGASRAVFVESSPAARACLERNIRQTGQSAHCSVCAREACAWLSHEASAPFDIVFADPPYALAETGFYESVMALLSGKGHLAAGGLFVAEMGHRYAPPLAEGWELLRDRVYGQSRIAVYRRK